MTHVIIADGDVRPADDDAALAILMGYWRDRFALQNGDMRQAVRFLRASGHPVASRHSAPLDRVAFWENLAKPRSAAPGPDGLTYEAWRLAPPSIQEGLWRVYLSIIAGLAAPPGFNHEFMVLFPKVMTSLAPVWPVGPLTLGRSALATPLPSWWPPACKSPWRPLCRSWSTLCSVAGWLGAAWYPPSWTSSRRRTPMLAPAGVLAW